MSRCFRLAWSFGLAAVSVILSIALRQYKSDVSTERVKRFRQRPRNAAETPPEQNRENRTELGTAALVEVTDPAALAVWDDYGRQNAGKSYPRNRRGGWCFPTKWPPGHEAEVHAIPTTGRATA